MHHGLMAADDVTEPAVRALIAAVNAGDREAFFTVHGHLDVVSARDGGRSLIAAYRNDTWGEMRTTWAFTLTGGKISRFETGQA